MKRLYWGVLAASLLAGCSTMKMETETVKLPEGRWQEAQPSIGSDPMSFEIKGNRISAYAGCNRMMGQAEMDGNQLVVGRMATTLMLCHGEEFEREKALNALISGKPKVEFNKDTLVLHKDDQAITFKQLPSLEGGKTRFIYVAAGKVPCTGVAPTECLQIREDEQEPWTLFYDDIEGFNPEPGIAYRLRIKEFAVENPPADASSKRWVLDMVIEQKVVNSDQA